MQPIICYVIGQILLFAFIHNRQYKKHVTIDYCIIIPPPPPPISNICTILTDKIVLIIMHAYHLMSVVRRHCGVWTMRIDVPR